MPVGSPTALLFGLTTPGPLPLLTLFPGFGLPGLLAVAPPFVTVPAGPSGPFPGPPVPLPLPATGGPVGTVGVHTLALLPVGGIAMTAATYITI